MKFTEEEVLKIVKEYSEKPEKWVKEAREKHEVLNALVTGKNFMDVLIDKIEHIEPSKRALARKKYSKDIRDLFYRVLNKRENVFDANGGSEDITINNETIRKLFSHTISNFKANKSLFSYLADNYLNLLDIDPNGVIFLEYKDKEGSENEKELYPTYKSIKDIRYYESKGQLLDYIIFEPKVKYDETFGISDKMPKIWRIVDDATDWSIKQSGGSFTVIPEKTFNHQFGKPPCIILSSQEEVGEEIRLSPIEPILEQAKDYARDKSILTIYKFINGFPLHWRFQAQCSECSGLGKIGGEESCGSCDGKGYMTRGDVTDVYPIPIPNGDQPNLAPNIAGYISPDLETWKQYNSDLKDKEILIEDTYWGTEKFMSQKIQNETATAKFIDTQPITNQLNKISNLVEYVHNTLANFVLNFVDKTKNKDEKQYHRSYGRRYIIESPDALLEKYQLAKEKGDNITILDKLLEEYILSKYKSDPKSQDIMLKKATIEPNVHLSNKEIYDYFGAEEVEKRVLFNKFWGQVEKTKDKEVLTQEFEKYYNENKSIINQNQNQNVSSKKTAIKD